MLPERFKGGAAAACSLSVPQALTLAESTDLRPQYLSEESYAGKPLRLHAQIARDLAVAILSGTYKPGDRLFGEIASSERLKVSRTAYREAVRILMAKGLVSPRPKAGTIVNPRSMWHLLDPEILSWAFERTPDVSLIEHLYELRAIVEPRAAAYAAERRTEEQLYTIRDSVERMADATLRTEEGRAADQEFHVAVLRATGNPYMASLATSLGAAICAITLYLHCSQCARRDSIPDHWRVFRAIADGDCERAETEMAALIRQSFLDIVELIDCSDREKSACSAASQAD
jgi:DNA-binding FadR family transcriptional regulator